MEPFACNAICLVVQTARTALKNSMSTRGLVDMSKQGVINTFAAGTRGPMDVVELPSHVMELFACSPCMLRTFARHRSS